MGIHDSCEYVKTRILEQFLYSKRWIQKIITKMNEESWIARQISLLLDWKENEPRWTSSWSPRHEYTLLSWCSARSIQRSHFDSFIRYEARSRQSWTRRVQSFQSPRILYQHLPIFIYLAYLRTYTFLSIRITVSCAMGNISPTIALIQSPSSRLCSCRSHHELCKGCFRK